MGQTVAGVTTHGRGAEQGADSQPWRRVETRFVQVTAVLGVVPALGFRPTMPTPLRPGGVRARSRGTYEVRSAHEVLRTSYLLRNCVEDDVGVAVNSTKYFVQVSLPKLAILSPSPPRQDQDLVIRQDLARYIITIASLFAPTSLNKHEPHLLCCGEVTYARSACHRVVLCRQSTKW